VVLQEVVERALTEAAQQRAASAVHLAIEIADEPLVVDGDPDDLVRMVGNILGNALKFTPAGGSVRLQVAADGRYARIDVTDTGIGIPPEELGLVFDGFFRSSRSQRNESPGTGLGLTIARSIADRHAGTIELRRNEPEGTAVAIRIPLVQQ
jgi:signal transduction histidine kinase